MREKSRLDICTTTFTLALLVVSGVAAADPLAAQSHFEPMDVFELEYAADPRISPDGSQVVYGPHVDGHHARREALGAVDRERRRLRPPAPGRGRVPALVAGRGANRLHGGRPDPRTLDGYRRGGDAHAASRIAPGPPLVAGRALPRVQQAGPVPAPPALPRHRSRPPGRSGPIPHHGGPLQEPAGRRRISGLRVRPHLHRPGRGRDAHAGHVGRLPAPELRRLDPGRQHLVFSSNRNENWVHDYRNSELYIVSVATGNVRRLTDRPGPDGSPAVSPDGRQIAFTGYEDRTRTYQVSRLQIMNLDGSGARVLTGDLDRSVSNPAWASDGSGIYFQYESEGNSKVGFASLDGDLEVLAEDLGGTSYGRPYGGGSFSVADDGSFALNQTRPESPGEVAVGARGRGVRRITSLNDDLLANRQLGDVEEIWWDSSFDGRPIQGWIVKPPDFDPDRRYPLILEIHGGPVSNYGDRFSAEMQLLAAAGYVVLYANPRGSTSYGEEFGDLLYHNYPGQDYDDLISGVDAVIARGYIDEDNLFVTGGSAGGIMTAWIVGKTDRFRAAVSQKPVVNWISKTLTADNWYGYYHSRYEGLPWENPDAYWEFSPISLVGNVTTPTMIITGEEDLRTPLSESYQMFHALKLRGIDTAVIRLPGASHDMSRRPSQLMAKIANIVAWFDKYRTMPTTS